MKKASLAFMVVCSIAVVACGGGAGPGASARENSGMPQVGQLEGADQACSRDVECTLVEDCCGCAAGGMRTGVRSDAVESVVERTAAECEARSCGSQASEHKSCTASAARCLGGRCVPAL